jgi:hypothetical protein
MIARVPCWVWCAVIVGLVGFAMVFQPWRSISDRAREAAQGLRDSSVYVAPGAPGVVDPQRIRKVLGDRAIVVAVFDDTPLTEYAGEDQPAMALCDDVAALVPTNLVVVFATDDDGEYDSAYCDGPGFPAPTKTGDSAEDFFFGVLVAAEQSWQYRATDTDLTPEIEEYVLTFDRDAAAAYGEIPRRGPVSGAPDVGRLILACLGMVSATVALFLLVRQAARLVRRRTIADRARRRRRAAADARLNRLADRLLRPSTAPDPEVIRTYVAALHQFRDAADEDSLSEAERRITEVEGSLL